MNIDKVVEVVSTNSTSLLTEGMDTSDIAQSPAFVGKLVKQVLSKSVLPKITSVIPMKKPSGFVYNLLAYYQGKDSDNKFNNTKIAMLDVDFTGDININITTTNGAVFTVEHFEGKYILIKVISGNIIKDDTFVYNTITYTFDAVYSSKVAVKKLFKNYSLNVGENGTPLEIGFNIIRTAMEVKSRKVISTLTQEAIQDIISQYGVDAIDIITEILSSETALEIDKEVIDYMKGIATAKTDLVLTNSDSSDLPFAYLSIADRINRELVELSKKHGKNITGFVVCSNNVVAALISAGVMSFGKSGNLDIQLLTDNDNTVGIMQQYVTVIQDKFADEDYVLVGWKQNDDFNGINGNAGIIFSPYSLSVHEFNEPESGKTKKMILNRYGFQRNGYDEGDDTSSDFFTTFNVVFSNLIGY